MDVLHRTLALAGRDDLGAFEYMANTALVEVQHWLLLRDWGVLCLGQEDFCNPQSKRPNPNDVPRLDSDRPVMMHPERKLGRQG